MSKLKENILFLTLKEPYFTQIKQGTKKFEYRSISPYFEKKLAKKYDYILFQNGYTKQSKRLLIQYLGVEIHLMKDATTLFKSETELFAIKLGGIIELDNFEIYK